MASPWHLLILHLFQHPDIPCSCWWEELSAIIAKNFRSLILEKILSHRRERRKTSSQNTSGNYAYPTEDVWVYKKPHKSRLSRSLGTSTTSRKKILSRNASCAGVPWDVMTWHKSSAHNQGKFTQQSKTLCLQPQKRKELGLRMGTCPQHVLWKQHYRTSEEHAFYEIPGSALTQEWARFTIRNAKSPCQT